MYPPSEVSPPPSFSRPRPWSPDPTDLPPLRSFVVRTPPGRTSATHPYPGHDAFEPSIDALDFADYTRTLNRYPFQSDTAYDDYLLPPPPRSVSVASHASLHPPSLVSSRGTPTSQFTSSLRHTTHGAFPPSVPVYSLTQPSVYSPPDNPLYSPNISHLPLDTTSSRGGDPNSEIDISQFPAWSRGWYAKDSRIPKTGTQSEVSHAPFFDPSYRATGLAENYGPYAATNNTSAREFVPWSNADTPNYDLPLDSELKEERIRMLEHEFRSGVVAPTEEPLGSIDEKGHLVTDGPKKRVAVRVIETVLALGIAVSVVYAALVRWYTPSRSALISVLVDQDPPTSAASI